MVAMRDTPIPITLEIKYASKTIASLLRHPRAFARVFGGAHSIDDFVQETYAKNPIALKRTHGFEIYLNPNDMGISPSIAVLGWYELRTTELFVEILRRGSTVVDVGANVGFFTFLAAKIVGPKGRVVSFEPEPTSFSLLARSLSRNKFSNVILIPKSLSDVEGERTLYLSATDHKGMHSIVYDSGGPNISVPSVKLDTEAARLGLDHIDLLKIDAEGAEPEILAGAVELLSERRVLNLIFEWEHAENWLENERLVRRLFSTYDAFLVPRSLPFLPIKKVKDNLALADMFQNRFGTNLYLRLRNQKRMLRNGVE